MRFTGLTCVLLAAVHGLVIFMVTDCVWLYDKKPLSEPMFTEIHDHWGPCHLCGPLVQCKPDISRSCISRNWIYCGRMIDPLFAHRFREFCISGAQERDIFREIAVTLCIQYARDIFSWNLRTVIAFVPVCWRQFFAKSTRAYLSMRAGTHAVRWAATLGGALTPPLCRRVGSS